jgi:hypothetical protein
VTHQLELISFYLQCRWRRALSLFTVHASIILDMAPSYQANIRTEYNLDDHYPFEKLIPSTAHSFFLVSLATQLQNTAT